MDNANRGKNEKNIGNKNYLPIFRMAKNCGFVAGKQLSTVMSIGQKIPHGLTISQLHRLFTSLKAALNQF
jgi:hypothetical protein